MKIDLQSVVYHFQRILLWIKASKLDMSNGLQLAPLVVIRFWGASQQNPHCLPAVGLFYNISPCKQA